MTDREAQLQAQGKGVKEEEADYLRQKRYPPEEPFTEERQAYERAAHTENNP